MGDASDDISGRCPVEAVEAGDALREWAMIEKSILECIDPAVLTGEQVGVVGCGDEAQRLEPVLQFGCVGPDVEGDDKRTVPGLERERADDAFKERVAGVLAFGLQAEDPRAAVGVIPHDAHRRGPDPADRGGSGGRHNAAGRAG